MDYRFVRVKRRGSAFLARDRRVILLTCNHKKYGKRLRMCNMSIWKSGIVASFLFGLPGIAAAHDYRIGSLHVDHPWAIATPNGAKTGAGYMKITNEGTEPDRLIAITSPASRKMTLHSSVTENGVTKMRKVD